MNEGPEHLPKPALFFSENETALETFLFCMYDFGAAESVNSRLFAMPFILLNTAFRLLSMYTCRNPVWSASIEKVSVIDDDDPYRQPRGETPVGWGPTALARDRGQYPSDPKATVQGWRGQKNPEENAYLWAADIPPQTIS